MPNCKVIINYLITSESENGKFYDDIVELHIKIICTV